MGFFRVLFIAVVVIFFTGCSSVHVYGDKGVSTKYYLGVVNVKVEAGGEVVAVNTEGFGFLGGYSRATFGWLKETVVTIDNSNTCSAVVIIDNEKQAKNIIDIIGYYEVLPNVAYISEIRGSHE